MKIFLAKAALAIAGVVTVQAADIAPVTGHWTKLGERFSALVYYIDKPDSFHVVVTTQQGMRENAAIARFETVQSAAVSIPRAAGETAARVVLSNASGHLHIAEPPDSIFTQ
jgi:hypothetical protein